MALNIIYIYIHKYIYIYIVAFIGDNNNPMYINIYIDFFLRMIMRCGIRPKKKLLPSYRHAGGEQGTLPRFNWVQLPLATEKQTKVSRANDFQTPARASLTMNAIHGEQTLTHKRDCVT